MASISLGDLDRFDFPMIRTTDMAELIIDIIKDGNPRLVYGVPFLIIKIFKEKTQPGMYIQRMLYLAHDDVLSHTLCQLIVTTADIVESSPIFDKVPFRYELQSIANSILHVEEQATILNAYVHNANYELANGISINIQSAQRTLETYECRARKLEELNHETSRRSIREEFRIQFLLSRIFAPKQKDIIMKRYLGESLTRTEAVVFSHTIRKRIEAVLDDEVQTILKRALVHKRRE